MTKNKRARTPLDELIATLQADPEYAAQWRKEREDRRQREIRQNIVDYAPLTEALRRAGFVVQSVWDLVNTSEPYTQAIPVLLEHLLKPYPDRVRGGIARALAVPDARFAWPIFVAEYCKLPKPDVGDTMGAKNALAVTLSANVTDATIGELIALAKDRSHGSSRLHLLRGLKRSKVPAAKQALIELAFDPELAKEIASWKKRKSPSVSKTPKLQ